MKYFNKYTVTIILILAAAYGYYWFSKSESENNEVEYVTAQVEKGTLTSSVSASGNITIDQDATVDPTISGTVTNLSVEVGDKVEEGQFLFDIINDELEVEVKKAEASYKQAQNNLESKEVAEDEAEASYGAAKKKDKKDPETYTREQLEVLEDKIDVAEEEIALAEKNLEASSASYQNTLKDAAQRKVTAPISGTVNEINIKNGDDLGKISSTTTKQSPIIIGDLNTLKAEVQVNEVDIAKVSVGQKAMLKFDSLDGLTVSGKVEKIDSLGTTTQNVVTYDVTIGFDTLDSRIKPEMSVSASIINDVKQGVFIIPSSAVKMEGNSYYVEVLKDNIPERKTVQIGTTNNTDTEVTSGLEEGDKVITQTIDPNATTSTQSSGQGSSGFRIQGIGGGGFRRD